MPDTLLQQKLFPYDGSQDVTKNPILISPKDIIDSDNIVYTTYSTKKLRPGVRQAFTPGGNRRIIGGIDFWRLGVQRVVYYDGTRLWAINPATGIRDDITGTHALPTDETVSFTVFQGLLIIFFGGGATPIKTWNQSGTINDLSATAPNAPFGRVWLNRLWVPSPTVSGRMLASATNAPAVFVGGDSTSVDLDVNDGDPDGITAVFPPFFSSLYVAKRLSIFKITPVVIADGTIVFTSPKISDGIGCISHNGVVAAEQNIFFPSDWGLHTFSSTDKISEIDTDLLSYPIQPEWVGDTNFRRSQYIQAGYDRGLNSVLVFFPAAAYNFPTDVWGYSLVARKWYRWKNFNHTATARYVDNTRRRLRTMVFSSTGQIGYLDDTLKADYGVKFGCSLQSGLISPAGAPDEQFSFNYLAPLFVPQIEGRFTITYKIDGRTIETKTYSMEDTSLGDEVGDDFVVGQSVLGGIPEIKFSKTRAMGYGMLYQLFVEFEPTDNDDPNVGFELLGIFVDVSPVTKGTGERVA